MTGKQIAKDRILGVSRAAANEVARIEISQDDRDIFRLKILLDAFAHPWADVLELDVAGSIALLTACGQQVLSGSFGQHDHCMRSLNDTLFERSQKTARPIELEEHFWNQGEIHVLAGHGCPRG